METADSLVEEALVVVDNHQRFGHSAVRLSRHSPIRHRFSEPVFGSSLTT